VSVAESSVAAAAEAPEPVLLVDDTPAGVRTIRLNRPARLNAVNPALAEALPAALAAAHADDAVRVVVITGAGRGFCAGLDLGEPAGLAQHTRAERLDPYRWVGHWVHAVVRCGKPVIAAINGAADGAGLGLALACDLRLLSSAATLTTGYVRRGLSPDAGVSWFLPQLVGHGRAMDLVLTGRDVSAGEALTMGLVTAAYPAEQFAEGVATYAAQLAAGAPLALARSKRLLLASWEASLDAQLRDELQQIAQCFASADVREAMAAFTEKRAPVFRGA
jgi:2-(1,2-epoxy-1,2-dihydrophenyl)acetyl-CoA isomerase